MFEVIVYVWVWEYFGKEKSESRSFYTWEPSQEDSPYSPLTSSLFISIFLCQIMSPQCVMIRKPGIRIQYSIRHSKTNCHTGKSESCLKDLKRSQRPYFKRIRCRISICVTSLLYFMTAGVYLYPRVKGRRCWGTGRRGLFCQIWTYHSHQLINWLDDGIL